MSGAESLNPFGGNEQNTLREFVTYDAHGAVERVKYIDEDLARFLQALENGVCGKIGVGIRNPAVTNLPSQHPLKLTPNLIRSRTRRKPAPEGRAWCWLFLNKHPDIKLSQSRISKLYFMDHTTVHYQVLQLSFALSRGSAHRLRKAILAVADDLAEAGFSQMSINDLREAA